LLPALSFISLVSCVCDPTFIFDQTWQRGVLLLRALATCFPPTQLHQGPQGRERVLAAVAGARLNCPHSLDLSRTSSTRMLV
jgi:hypothetical protein